MENIIRVGSAGAMRADMELGSVCAGMGACTNSSFADQYELGATYAPICNYDLLAAAVESANELGVKMPVGNLYSSDTFYDAAGRNARFGKMGVMAVEMEAAGLYCTAAYTGKRALAICSISDNLVTGEELSADERQTTFTNMMKIAPRGRGQDGEQRIRSVFLMRVIDIENITEAMRDDTRFVLRCEEVFHDKISAAAASILMNKSKSRSSA